MALANIQPPPVNRRWDSEIRLGCLLQTVYIYSGSAICSSGVPRVYNGHVRPYGCWEDVRSRQFTPLTMSFYVVAKSILKGDNDIVCILSIPKINEPIPITT